MSQIEITLLISLGVLLLVLVFLNLNDTLSPKKGLSIITCLLLYWCIYALYNIHSAKQKMGEIQENIERLGNSFSEINGNLSEAPQAKAGENNEINGNGMVFWTDGSRQHGLMADDDDLGAMNWEEAKRACEAKGNGWHLPTKEELQKLYENKDKVSGLENDAYWSSSEYNAGNAWIIDFSNGGTGRDDKYGTYYVRAVRAF